MNLLPKQDSCRAKRAFTLVDAMVGMGVLGITMLSLFASFTFGFNVVKLSREELRATQILHEKMETIRLYNWTQLNQTNYVPTTFSDSLGGNATNFFTGAVLITNVNFTEAYKAQLRKVVVSVSWTNSNVKYTRSISTFVSNYGLQNYIFQ